MSMTQFSSAPQAGERMVSVLVVDDEPLARARMQTLLSDCREPAANFLGEARDAMDAMNKLRSLTPDAILLDIHMPGADGLQLARELRELKPSLSIIFVTAHAEHAVQAFELEADDYLTKPVRLERLEAALRRALFKKELLAHNLSASQSGLNDTYVIIQDRGRTERVSLADVLYFKAELKYITVRTAQRSYILDGSLTDLENQYVPDFLRIHRNTLVATREMRALERYHGEKDAEDGETAEAVEGWAVRLKSCDDALPVSRRQLTHVRSVIAQN